MCGVTTMGTDREGDRGTDRVRGLLPVGCMRCGVQCSCRHQLGPSIESWFGLVPPPPLSDPQIYATWPRCGSQTLSGPRGIHGVFRGQGFFFLVEKPGLGLVALCLQPPSVTLQLPSVTHQPPPVTLQPPSFTPHPPSVTLQPPSVALRPPSVTPSVPSVGAVQILLTTGHTSFFFFFFELKYPPGE